MALSFVEKTGCPRRVVHPQPPPGRQELSLPGRHDGGCPCWPAANPQPPAIEKQIESEPYATASEADPERAPGSVPPTAATLTREIIMEIEKQEQNCRAAEIRTRAALNLIAELLNNADVLACVVHALSLEDGRRRQELVDYLQVFNSRPTDYKLFNPQKR